jgi:histidine triad (HIT) family protein
MSSIFTRIVNRELPAKVFLEDDNVIVIEDIRPRLPVHLLIIPKTETTNFYETSLETLTMLNEYVKKIAAMLEIGDHFQLVINNGLGQEIDHLHFHFLSDRGADKLQFTQFG